MAPSGLSQPTAAISVSTEQIQAKLDLAIALALAAWPALSLAVQNLWGGPSSADKRDWFAGAISELLDAASDADAQYVEEFMLQVMNDEFGVNVEDGSGEEVAESILKLKDEIKMRDFSTVDEMLADWRRKRAKGGEQAPMFVEGKEEDQEVDSESEFEGFGDDDTTMDEAPQLVRTQEKPIPELDEEGFAKVTRHKNR